MCNSHRTLHQAPSPSSAVSLSAALPETQGAVSEAGPDVLPGLRRVTTMDTTLITFHLLTSPSVHSVHLIGSWDNFARHYTMERDVRRAGGQWRGCYTFEGITCDGDGENRPKRTGGLRMGQTYYYYYELDDGTEIHDPSVPSTTTCPYLPGQPVNLLWVPVEAQTPRDRSASMSLMSTEDIKTMIPADKFLTPRPPPPIPLKRSRSNTAPMSITRKPSARSTSPGLERQQWSPKMLFRRRLPSSPSQKGDSRRRWSPLGKIFGDDASGNPPPAKWLQDMKHVSMQATRATSTRSISRPLSHELPLRLSIPQDTPTHSLPTFPLPMPEGIEEEIDDDDENFANQLNRMALTEDEQTITPLSPPSLGRHSSRHSSFNTSKHLPRPPIEDSTLPKDLSPSHPPRQPPLIRSRRDVSSALHPRSHLSASTTVTSPTASYFDFSDDEEDDDVDADDLFVDSPAIEPASPAMSTPRYELPDAAAAAAEHALIRKHAVEALAQVGSRTTFGGADGGGLDELRSELGYLGGVIVSK